MQRERRLLAAAAVNVAVVLGQLGAGLAAGSLSLLADAGHNLTDTAALVLAFAAIRVARRPPAGARTYGYHRTTVLAAQANAALVIVVTVLVAGFAVNRLVDPPRVDATVVVATAAVVAVLNLVAALLVREPGGGDLNMSAALLHMGGDALVSLGVALGGLVMLAVGGAYWLDPSVGLLISALIAWQGYRLLRRATDVLLEASPPGIDIGDVRNSINAAVGVVGVHDLHVWSLSDVVHALSAHVVVEGGDPSLASATEIGTRLKEMLADDYTITHVTLEFEADRCATPLAQHSEQPLQG